jgi:outer membrane protein insertion porin family
MKVKEGAILDAAAVRKSSEYLQRLDFFEEVSVTPEPTVQEDLMDIIVEVKEKATGTFSVGAGYSSVDNMMFMGEISENNLLGKGQRLSLQANLSSSTTRYNLNFTEPRLNDTKLLFGYDLYNWQREYDDYTKDSTGGALRFGYPIWNKWRLGWSYGFDDTKLTDISATASQDIIDSLDIETTSFIKVALSKDSRNRYTDTSSGAVHSLSVKHAGLFLGGDSSFTKIEATTSWYFPFRWDTVFHAKGAFGYAMENETNKLPVYEKFYLGGLNTVRGFENGKISPKDPITNERIGGEKMWYGNLEWIFPIVKEAGLKGVVFFDTGNTYEDSDSWDFADLRYSVGFGFRWLSPMGPLRLEWGYNLDPEPDEDQGIWDFSLGGSF